MSLSLLVAKKSFLKACFILMTDWCYIPLRSVYADMWGKSWKGSFISWSSSLTVFLCNFKNVFEFIIYFSHIFLLTFFSFKSMASFSLLLYVVPMAEIDCKNSLVFVVVVVVLGFLFVVCCLFAFKHIP